MIRMEGGGGYPLYIRVPLKKSILTFVFDSMLL
jgi:hypothetical protein